MNDTTFDLAVLMENLKDPTAYALLAIVLGAVTVAYALLTYWTHITEQEEDDE